MNDTATTVKFTDNKIIMHFVKQYIVENEVYKNIYDQLNHVYLYKKIIIPAELVGIRGGQETKCYYDFDAKSSLQ